MPQQEDVAMKNTLLSTLLSAILHLKDLGGAAWWQSECDCNCQAFHLNENCASNFDKLQIASSISISRHAKPTPTEETLRSSPHLCPANLPRRDDCEAGWGQTKAEMCKEKSKDVPSKYVKPKMQSLTYLLWG